MALWPSSCKLPRFLLKQSVYFLRAPIDKASFIWEQRRNLEILIQNASMKAPFVSDRANTEAISLGTIVLYCKRNEGLQQAIAYYTVCFWPSTLLYAVT